MGVSKNSGKTSKMDGENNGKPYEQMDDLGGNPSFWETAIYRSSHGSVMGAPTEAPRDMGEAQKEDVELSQSKAKRTHAGPVSNIWVFPKMVVPPNHPF